MEWRRPFCPEAQFEMVDDSIDYRIICDEGDDLHLSMTFGTEKGIDFIDLLYHLGPGFAWMSRAIDSCHSRKDESKNRPRYQENLKHLDIAQVSWIINEN